MPTITIKDPITKKNISIYKALLKGDLDTLKRVYEINKEDVSIFNMPYNGFYPYDWIMRKNHFDIIEYFISIRVEPIFDHYSFANLYKYDFNNDFKLLDQLLTIPNINILSVCWKALTPNKFKREQFIKIMNHSNTRFIYDKYNYGHIEGISSEKDIIGVVYDSRDNFWISLMNMHEDIFNILLELGYIFNPLNILERFSYNCCNCKFAYDFSYPFNKIMLKSILDKIKSNELNDKDKETLDTSMYILLCYNNGSSNFKNLIQIYNFDFNIKLIKKLHHNKYLDKHYSNFNRMRLYPYYSLIENMIIYDYIYYFKFLLKHNGGVIKSNSLLFHIFNRFRNYEIGNYIFNTNIFNMFNFLNDNYHDILFCDDHTNWEFDYNNDYKYDFGYNINNIDEFNKMIIEKYEKNEINEIHEKYLHIITYILFYNTKDDQKYILKLILTNITKNTSYIEKYILIHQKSIINKYKSIIDDINSNINSNNINIIKNFNNDTLKCIKLYQECGFTFSESFLTNPNFTEIDNLKTKILSM